MNTDDETQNIFDGIPYGLFKIKEMAVSLAIQTNTSPAYYKDLSLLKLMDEIEVFNSVVEK